MHKIFKLCGSPSESYWKKTKFPHATSFKPSQPYKRRLMETFKDFPSSALALVDALLSIEPEKRGTASSALKSEVIDIGFWCFHFLFLMNADEKIRHSDLVMDSCWPSKPYRSLIIRKCSNERYTSSHLHINAIIIAKLVITLLISFDN